MFESATPSELPPQPPRAFFGRDELVDQIVRLAEDLTPLALIGPGGIGKTSIAMTILHNHRIKQRFGDERRFIRCDRFPASLSHFLRRLSAVTGAGVENPEDLTPLQPFLSSKEMLIVLDNAESVLDPRRPEAREIYAVVGELSRFDNMCICITSRISTIPPDYETLDIPTLSMQAARDTFYRIYKNGERSDAIDNILKQLDFHPLSITLLATVAHQNKWDTGRLAREWESRRTDVLRTDHDESLAAAIELSLASPMFQELGPDARALLEAVAFFPQGIDENNLEWLFPTISNRDNISDKFCVLSLTYRSNGFATMLAPLRDLLCPKDPRSSPLLRAIKECYFSRLVTDTHPHKPSFKETQWITSEDVNVEHLLDVFTSVDAMSNEVWDACAGFMRYLRWHKSRLTVLGSKIEGLPDGHPSKTACLFALALLFHSLGNPSECKRLLTCALELHKERGDDDRVALMLCYLANLNWYSKHYAEGIPQAMEASEIYERLNNTAGQASSLQCLALLLTHSGQPAAAEEAAYHVISNSFTNRATLCEHYHILGHIRLCTRETEVAISLHERAINIASSFGLREKQVSILCCLVALFLKEGRLNDAQAHLESLKLDTSNSLVSQALTMVTKVCVWRRQGMFEEAESEISRVMEMWRKIGVPADFLEYWKGFLREVEEKVNTPVTSD